MIGVFGFSITIGEPNSHSLSKALSLITETGLFSGNTLPIKQQQIFKGPREDIYFSKRELECIYHMTSGKTTKEIAKILQVSPRTVEFYLKNIKTKMNVSSRTAIIEKFLEYSSLIPKSSRES